MSSLLISLAISFCVLVVASQRSGFLNKEISQVNSRLMMLQHRDLQLRGQIRLQVPKVSEVPRMREIPKGRKRIDLPMSKSSLLDCAVAKQLEKQLRIAYNHKFKVIPYWGGYCLFSQSLRSNYSTDLTRFRSKNAEAPNLVLKASTVEFPPYVTQLSPGKYRGYCLEILNALSKTLDLKYSFTVMEPTNKAPGGFINNSWNGIVGTLISGEVDIGIGAFTITYARAQVIDFTYPIFEESTAILIPPLQEESKLLACFQPFVWMSILAAMILISLVLWLILYYSWKHKLSPAFSQGIGLPGIDHRPKPTFGTQVIFAFGVIITQAGTCAANTHSSRVLAGAWCLAALIFVYVYNSTLMSFLTISRQKALANNIDDVALGHALTLTVMKSTSFDSLMMTATTGTYKILGDSLRQNPERRVASTDEGVRRVLTGQHAFIMDKTVIDELIYNDWRAHRERNGPSKCRLTESKEPFYKSSVALMVPKSSPYSTLINSKMLVMHEAGLMHYWGRRSFPPPNPCLDFSSRAQPRSRALTLVDLQSAFLTYALGWMAALVVSALELQRSRFSRSSMIQSQASERGATRLKHQRFTLTAITTTHLPPPPFNLDTQHNANAN